VKLFGFIYQGVAKVKMATLWPRNKPLPLVKVAMSNLYNTLVALSEKPVGDIMRKQRSIYRLFPSFDDRVDKVAAKGGVRLVDEGPDTWKFTIASATVDGKKYSATLHFADLDAQIRDKARNKTLWNKDGTKVDYNKLAAAIIDDVDVRIDHEDCPAFLYWGQKYITTQRQTAYKDKEDRRPRIRNPKEYGHLCKHLQLLFEQLPFYTSTFAKMLKRNHAATIADVEGGAKTVQKGFSKAADFLGARQGGGNGPSTGPTPAKPSKPSPSSPSGADKLRPSKDEQPSANNDVKNAAKDNTETPKDGVKKGVKSATGDIDVLSKEEQEERDRMAGEGGIPEAFKRLMESVEITPEMIKYFEDRTNKHINLVRQSIKKIAEKFPEFSELIERGKVHDDSKFKEPERTPYILLTWQNKTDRNGKPTDHPAKIDKGIMQQATLHHITTNSHHPEYWDKRGANVDHNDRNNSRFIVDASNMPQLDIAEMVADWNAMSEELRSNTPRQWFEKMKDVRWHFSQEQEQLIDKLLTTFE
jgi:hypothetical protein